MSLRRERRLTIFKLYLYRFKHDYEEKDFYLKDHWDYKVFDSFRNVPYANLILLINFTCTKFRDFFFFERFVKLSAVELSRYRKIDPSFVFKICIISAIRLHLNKIICSKCLEILIINQISVVWAPSSLILWQFYVLTLSVVFF